MKKTIFGFMLIFFAASFAACDRKNVNVTNNTKDSVDTIHNTDSVDSTVVDTSECPY